MKITERRVRSFALGILAALVGYALCACDGGAGDGSDAGEGLDAGRADAEIESDAGTPIDAGLASMDAGVIRCAIPSPTGDGAVSPQFVLGANDARSACEASKSYWVNTHYFPEIAGVDCLDAAHDFKGTTGKSWCLSLFVATDVEKVCPGLDLYSSECTAKWTDTAAPWRACTTADTICETYGVSAMLIPIKKVAACSSSGVFQGWLCSQ